MSKLLWSPWISYLIEAPSKHYMSIQAKTFCKETLNLICETYFILKRISFKWFYICKIYLFWIILVEPSKSCFNLVCLKFEKKQSHESLDFKKKFK